MSARNPVYLDHNATAPLHPRVVEALRVAIQGSAFPGFLIPNSSSIHSRGRAGRQLLSEARERIARSLGPGVRAEQVLLTSSGTEANQTLIQGLLEPAIRAGLPAHWVLSAVEHASIAGRVPWAEALGIETTILPVDSRGLVSVADLERALTPATRLVSLIAVNNETGVLSPIAEVSAVCRARGVPLHVDAAQAWGKLPMGPLAEAADWLTLSSHKIGAPAGTGILVRLGGGPWPQALISGAQENGRRGGTENLLGAYLTGIAAEAAAPEALSSHGRSLRESLEKQVLERIPGVRINGAGAPRSEGVSSLSFEGAEGADLTAALDLEGFCVSAGSACTAGVLKPSRVLMAMGHTAGLARASIRVSVGAETRPDELNAFVSALERVVNRARSVRAPEARP